MVKKPDKRQHTFVNQQNHFIRINLDLVEIKISEIFCILIFLSHSSICVSIERHTYCVRMSSLCTHPRIFRFNLFSHIKFSSVP